MLYVHLLYVSVGWSHNKRRKIYQNVNNIVILVGVLRMMSIFNLGCSVLSHFSALRMYGCPNWSKVNVYGK